MGHLKTGTNINIAGKNIMYIYYVVYPNVCVFESFHLINCCGFSSFFVLLEMCTEGGATAAEAVPGRIPVPVQTPVAPSY